jgi:putative DNA primase/helicase
MLANGSKKVRSDASGDSKPTAKWRILYLSSGETNLAGHLMQVGKKTRAGQEVR